MDISDPNGYIYNGQCFFYSSGSNDEEEFYDGDDDWDSHHQLYEGGMDGGRDVAGRNHDSEGTATPINVHDNQSDS